MAQVIGVSESSLKRWADGGKLRVTRTMGGHRRIALQEAVRFVREARLPVVKPELLGITSLEKLPAEHRAASPEGAGETLERFLRAGQADAARGLMVDLYLKGKSVAWLCDGPVRRALGEIGKVWEHDSKGIYLEHRALDICVQIISQLRLLVANPALEPNLDDESAKRPVALGAAPSNDPYILASLICASIAAESGYQDINLGANLPLGALREAAEQHRPRLVWLSCTWAEAMPSPREIDELGEDLSKIGASLVVGGQAGPHGGGASENVRVCESMAELSAFACGLYAAS